ncbi:hypothetical protein EDB89DRAFT_1920417 [Lactarius sanguifluus]|nr:hypothetical protein EDB89DRAFT_1920417 [Lactarius sanguifluus]
MPRRKTAPSQLRQQSLNDFLKPNSLKANGSCDNTARTKPRQAGRTARSLPSRVPEPFDQSDTDSGVEAIHFEPKKVASSDDGDDVQPSSPVRKRRAAVEAESQADSEMSASSDSDMGTERKVPSNKMKSPRARSPSIEVTLPKRRRLAKGVRPPSPEETDNLLLEVNEADIIQSRFRHRQKRTRFQQNLEKLKKRKLRITESSDEQTGEDDGHDSHEPFQGSQKDGHIGDPDADDDDEDDDTDDFVVEDDGVAIPELPVAFSRRTHQDSSHDFKVVCQLFVHLAMMPVDERRGFMEQILKGDDYFLVPFQVIRRKLSDARDSVASSIWRRDYKEALELLPDLTLSKLDFSTPHCDACNVRKKSTVAGWLKGTPYDKLSFEPIIDERNSEDPDEEDRRVTGFSFGRFCAIRTQIYHRLTHWSYHLYGTLSEEIDLVQCPGKKRPFSRSWNLSPPEDTSNPDDITEWLDKRGIVSAEWQKLCDLLQRASSLDSWEEGRD